MTSIHTQVIAREGETGNEITAQQHESDTPFLPVQQLERLHAFRPDLVDWVVQETGKEAEHRRCESNTVNTYVFVERLVGMILAAIIGLAGIGGGGYLALNGQPWAGTTIAGAMIGTLAVAFLRREKQTQEREPENPPEP
ncbi:MAG: hypothetical protein LBP86_06650 [Azoarcus sp.]|jgi:hypothetical protein|nr:hypothetical protein [Azoarcus sp.]